MSLSKSFSGLHGSSFILFIWLMTALFNGPDLASRDVHSLDSPDVQDAQR